MRYELLTMLGGLFSGGKNSGELHKRAVAVQSENFDYQVYVPQAAQTESLPVFVFLHGIRERGAGGFLPSEGAGALVLRQYLAQVPAIILLPQCSSGTYWTDPVMDAMVMKSLAETIEEFGADSNRVCLIGVSMGGYGVWHFAAEHPNQFAALVSICGGSPILTGDRFAPVAGKVGATPAWIFHGDADPIVPVSESREMVKALKAVGSNVKYSEFAGVGHNVWMNALAEKQLLPWLLSNRLK
ncbi:MAG TPA: prolyl oligopeptidase family serine peptidase [Pyrinomonadaceae bacterium]|jgi:predicted peptidase